MSQFFYPKVCSQLLSDLRETVSSEEEEKEEDGDAHVHKSGGEKSHQKGNHHHYGRQQSTAPLPPPSKPPSLRRFLTDFFLRVIRPAILVDTFFKKTICVFYAIGWHILSRHLLIFFVCFLGMPRGLKTRIV